MRGDRDEDTDEVADTYLHLLLDGLASGPALLTLGRRDLRGVVPAPDHHWSQARCSPVC